MRTVGLEFLTYLVSQGILPGGNDPVTKFNE